MYLELIRVIVHVVAPRVEKLPEEAAKVDGVRVAVLFQRATYEETEQGGALRVVVRLHTEYGQRRDEFTKCNTIHCPLHCLLHARSTSTCTSTLVKTVTPLTALAASAALASNTCKQGRNFRLELPPRAPSAK